MLGQRMMMAAAGVGPPIPVTTNLLGWWRADLGVVKDGSNLVSQWNDLQGSRDLTEGTNKPLWVGNGPNGMNTIRFDGINDSLQESGGDISQPHHVFIVGKWVAWAQSRVWLGSITTPGIRLFGNTPSPEMVLFPGGTNTTQVSTVVGTYYLIIYLVDDANSYLLLNDAGIARSGSGTRVVVDGLQVGTNISDDGQAANIEIAEIAFYTSEKTGADLTSIKDYFNTRYALGF